MTTRPDHHEPLDAEERDLAARLGRAGPIDGPSPALDARILAAAHAVAARHKPRRHGRLAWLGVPPAMITGVGVAAAAVLALGLVWQLRPNYGRTVSHAEADGAEEVIIFAEPSSAPRAQKANPPPLQDEPARDSSADRSRSSAATDAAAMAQANARAERAASERAASQQAVSEAAKAAETESDLAAQAIPRGAPLAEAAPEAAAATGNVAAAEGFTPEPPAAATPVRKSHATYTTAARATAERRERPKVAAAPAAPPPAPASAAADASAESSTLDRIEVTGSRMDWSQVPVNDDTQLPAAEWLERIRARRDGADVDTARASLRLFRREHPRARIPDDLRALLAIEAPR